MLDGGSDMVRLYATDKCRRCFPGEVRILGVIFEVASAQRGTLDVYGWAEYDRQVVCLRFLSDGVAEGAHQVTVKGAGAQDRRRKANRFDTVVDSKVVGFFILLAESVGAVAHHNARNPKALHAFQMPKVKSGAHSCLFFQGHLTYQFF